MSYVIKNKAGATFNISQENLTVEQLKKKAKSNGWKILKPYSVADLKRDVEESGKEMVECEICGSEFATKKGLRIHQALVHKGEVTGR